MSTAGSVVATNGAGHGRMQAGTPLPTYLTRIFAGRAIALGAGYITEPAAQRRRWQRLGLVVDVTDTLAAGPTCVAGTCPARQCSRWPRSPAATASSVR